MAHKKIEHKADKGQHFTLDDLDAFIRDARASGATGSEPVEARVSWGGKITQLAVNVEVGATARAVPLQKD